MAIDLYNLASLYKAQGRFAEALALTGRAIGIVSRQIAVASNVRSSTARPPPISAAIKILLDMVRDIEGQGRRWASSKRWYAGHPVPAAISAGEFLQASGGWGQ